MPLTKRAAISGERHCSLFREDQTTGSFFKVMTVSRIVQRALTLEIYITASVKFKTRQQQRSAVTSCQQPGKYYFIHFNF